MLLFPPRSEARVWLGVAWERRSWAIGEDKEGPQLGPFRVGSLAILLFDVLIGSPESCEAVCFFFFPEARASGRRSWAIGEDKEGPELGPFRVGSLAVLGV